MKFYHWTKQENIDPILKLGLIPNPMGFVYISPNKEDWEGFHGEESVCLEVETGDLKVTAFEDCREWERLCWGRIPPENITVLKGMRKEDK